MISGPCRCCGHRQHGASAVAVATADLSSFESTDDARAAAADHGPDPPAAAADSDPLTRKRIMATRRGPERRPGGSTRAKRQFCAVSAVSSMDTGMPVIHRGTRSDIRVPGPPPGDSESD
jgi:hypothetical protein